MKDLLLLQAYLNKGQTQLLPTYLEIEHILPQKNKGILTVQDPELIK